MEIIILIERKSKYIEEFLEILNSKKYISFRELRRRFPSTIANETIESFVYKTNNSVKMYKIEVFNLEIVEKEDDILKIYKIYDKSSIENTKYHHVIKIET